MPLHVTVSAGGGVRYAPQIIQDFADALYREARRALTSAILGGFFLGAAFGVATGRGELTLVSALGLGVVGALVGFAVGRGRAATLRLRAQVALCQVQIEMNTRRPPQPGQWG